jgi:glycolate oxidase iron-sulfur subunit
MILPPLREQGELSVEEREFYHTLSQCVRCAACLPTCPTFQETLDEGHSPRGRISLVRALHEGDGTASNGLNTFLYGCLECRACETSCPNNVIFHEIIEYGKESLNRAKRIPTSGKFFKWLFLGKIFRSARAFDMFMAFLRFYMKSGLRAIVRFSRILRLMPWHVADLEKLTPTTPGKHRPARRKNDYILIPAGGTNGTVQFFTGCIADHWLQKAQHATIRMLLRAGYSVFIPGDQQCCGALHIHLGEKDAGATLARANIAAFSKERFSDTPIISNAAGCGAMLKEYGDILRREPDIHAGETFAARTRDFSEFLADNLNLLPKPEAMRATVTFDDPCHLLHGQGICNAPRQLIRFVPGVEFRELEESSWCCGSAGVYNIVNFGMSMKLLDRKLQHIRASGCEKLITANPGCYLQLSYGIQRAGLDIEVLHVAEYLDGQYPDDPPLSDDSDTPPWL